MKIHSEDAYHLLYRLGATANYTGFSYLVRALQLCAEEPERLLLVTKWLYPDVAKQYGTNWKAVERDIRTVGRVIWNSNRPLLETLARRELPKSRVRRNCSQSCMPACCRPVLVRMKSRKSFCSKGGRNMV